jgi:feruloyl-CoA synthase
VTDCTIGPTSTRWREESYISTLQKLRPIAASLLARGMGPENPILIMSNNGVDHGLLTLVAQYVGVPTVPLSEQYSLITGAHGRLQHAIELVRPKMAYDVIDDEQYTAAIVHPALKDVEIVATGTGQAGNVTSFDSLPAGDNSVDVDAALASLTPDTVAKTLMTSGSTSLPKGVLTTQKMMCVNQAQLADSLRFLRARPPRVVD